MTDQIYSTRQALDPRYQVHDQILTKYIKSELNITTFIKYMSRKSRSVIFSESKNDVKRQGGGMGDIGYSGDGVGYRGRGMGV